MRELFPTPRPLHLTVAVLFLSLFLAFLEPAFHFLTGHEGLTHAFAPGFGIPRTWLQQDENNADFQSILGENFAKGGIGRDYLAPVSHLKMSGFSKALYTEKINDTSFAGAFSYPPLMAVFMGWAPWLPLRTSLGVWAFFVMVSLLVLSWAWSEAGRRFAAVQNSAPYPKIFSVITAFLLALSYPSLFSFERGNNDVWVLWILSLVAYGLYRRRWFWSGAGLTTATLLKVYPVFLSAAFILASLYLFLRGAAQKNDAVKKAGLRLLAGQAAAALAVLAPLFSLYSYFIVEHVPWLEGLHAALPHSTAIDHSLPEAYGLWGFYPAAFLWSAGAGSLALFLRRWAENRSGDATSFAETLFPFAFLAAVCTFLVPSVSADYNLILALPLVGLVSFWPFKKHEKLAGVGLLLFLLGFSLPRWIGTHLFPALGQGHVFLVLEFLGLAVMAVVLVLQAAEHPAWDSAMEAGSIRAPERRWPVFLAVALVMLAVCGSSGALSSGFQFEEDYEILQIHEELSSGGGLWATLARYVLKDQYRIRIYYPFRVLQTFFFGSDMVWFRTALFLMGLAAAYGLYRFGRRFGFTLAEALVFSGLVLLGPQTAVWWRMGNAENLGMFFLSLSLFFAVWPGEAGRWPVPAWLRETGFVVSAALMSFAKESFIVAAPALLFLKVWGTREAAACGWRESIQRNLFSLLAMGGVLFLQSVLIFRVTGLVVAGYAGFDGVHAARLADTLFRQIGLENLVGLGLFAGFTVFSVFRRGECSLGEAVKRHITPVFVFLLLMVVPLAILFHKTGMMPHYLLPGTFASALLLLAWIRVFRLRRVRMGVVCGWVVLASLLTARASLAWEAGKRFAEEGRLVQKLIRTVRENTRPEDAVLMVLDPVRHLEWNHAMMIYLENFAGRGKVYFYPLLRKDYTPFQRYLLLDQPDSPFKLYRGRVFDATAQGESIRTIIVFPQSVRWFAAAATSWFDRSKYRMEPINPFVVFHRESSVT